MNVKEAMEKNVKWIEWDLYDGHVRLRFSPGAHRYQVLDGKQWKYVVGTTTITGQLDKSNALVPWAARKCSEYLLANWPEGRETAEQRSDYANEMRLRWRTLRDDAGARGESVHRYAEAVLQHRFFDGPKPELPEDEQARLGCKAFHEWLSLRKPKPRFLERVVYSRRYGFAGTVDFVGDLVMEGDDRPQNWVIDYKTRGAMKPFRGKLPDRLYYPEEALQVSGYAGALEEELGLNCSRRMVLHFDQETGVPSEHIIEQGQDESFLAFGRLVDVYRWRQS